MRRYRLTTQAIRRALDAVAEDDADVREALREFGYPTSRRRPEGFATLLRVIVGQQVSVAAARTIYGRLVAAMGEDQVSAQRLLRMREATLRKAGLSASKARYARCLARAIDSGSLELDDLARLADEEALQQIQAVPGLGLWSAQMYLMFSLGRPDIWPAADVGALRGLQRIKRLRARPSPQDSGRLTEPFQPYRSAIALLAWKCAGAPAPRPNLAAGVTSAAQIGMK